jgi:hypothetical protein
MIYIDRIIFKGVEPIYDFLLKRRDPKISKLYAWGSIRVISLFLNSWVFSLLSSMERIMNLMLQ